MHASVAAVQFQPRKGEIEANLERIGEIFAQLAGEEPPDLIIFPEACTTGYFLEGAVHELARSAEEYVEELQRRWRAAAGSRRVDVVLGFYEHESGTVYNAALYATLGGERAQLRHVHRKLFLPTYGVFDEARFVSRGRRISSFATSAFPSAILICEDAWHSISATVAALKGAQLVLIPSASPGRGIAGPEIETVAHWRTLLQNTALEHGVYIVYAGLVGFEGGKGFTGTSMIVAPDGRCVASGPPFDECVVRATLDSDAIDVARAGLPFIGDLRSVLPDLLLDQELPLPHGGRVAP
ncbi:MAG: beta-ureidopropionase [bacterium]|nr:beta-ureidopropionase [bacterium]